MARFVPRCKSHADKCVCQWDTHTTYGNVPRRKSHADKCVSVGHSHYVRQCASSQESRRQVCVSGTLTLRTAMSLVAEVGALSDAVADLRSYDALAGRVAAHRTSRTRQRCRTHTHTHTHLTHSLNILYVPSSHARTEASRQA